MKTFKQFREECGCKDKARKSKKKGNVEVMPTVNDGQKGMVSQVNNEGVEFAGNYEGPLYAPHPDLIKEKAPEGEELAEKKLDPVNHGELKGKHSERKDKDIDNDGDVDKSDKYLHMRRKKVSKIIAMKGKK